MTRGGFTVLRLLLAAVLATVAVCGGCMRKGVRLADLRAALPDASTVRLYDRPSDDGSAIILEWGKVDDVVEGVSYAVEVAKSDDFKAGQFKIVKVEPAEDSLKSADPKYFGFSEANKKFYVATILPAELFAPADAPELTADHIKTLVADGALSREQSKLILAEMASDTPDEELTDDEKACRKWLRRLKLYPRVVQLADDGKLPDSTVQRAIRAMTDETADDALSGGDKADRRWLAQLAAFIEKQGTKQRDRAAKAINDAVYYVRLAATDGRKQAYVLQDREKAAVYSGQARPNTFKRFKLNNLVFALVFSGIVLAFIQIARRNPNLFIRRIAGLEAVDEAIGRATEMGRSVYFVHGLGSMAELATIAAVNVLSRVARRAADYDTRVTVMNINPIVMAVSQEVVQQAYTEAGRPDAYDPDDVALSATSQFSYAAAVTGRMVRERPAAIFLIGSFMAESLLLSETGASTGAIQVAGTDSEHQLPFFITTCDYTLIGEELYAASAYLSREPRMLGSLRGQDVGKAFMMITMVIGVILLTIAAASAWFDADWITHLVKVL